MGIFDFMKDAGAKILGAGEEVVEHVTKPLRKHVEEHGIGTEGLDFRFHDGGIVTITGAVSDQETREKIVLIIGNVQGVSQVDDQMTIGAAAVTDWNSRTYTVERGDTLGGIAKKMYGNAGKYPAIFEANKPMLSDPDKIYPGQVLRIPPLPE